MLVLLVSEVGVSEIQSHTASLCRPVNIRQILHSIDACSTCTRNSPTSGSSRHILATAYELSWGPWLAPLIWRAFFFIVIKKKMGQASFNRFARLGRSPWSFCCIRAQNIALRVRYFIDCGKVSFPRAAGLKPRSFRGDDECFSGILFLLHSLGNTPNVNHTAQ